MFTLLLLSACRPDPGDPSYPDPFATDTGDTGESGFLAGPDPYEDGEARMSFGAFYEGGYSEILPVDDVTRHYYIWERTFTQTVDGDDRVEGFESAVILHGGGAWWGGGIHWDSAEDLGAWNTLHVSLKSVSASFADIELLLTGGGQEVILAAADYGWLADGEWHHLSVPLADFAAGSADFGALTDPFAMKGGAGAAGDELRVDNLYFTAP